MGKVIQGRRNFYTEQGGLGPGEAAGWSPPGEAAGWSQAGRYGRGGTCRARLGGTVVLGGMGRAWRSKGQGNRRFNLHC